MFTVLPFGLCITCYLVTKVVCPLVRYWRLQGLRVLVYLDDGLGAAASMEEACIASEMVRATLNNTFFVAHPTKSVWKPTSCL